MSDNDSRTSPRGRPLQAIPAFLHHAAHGQQRSMPSPRNHVHQLAAEPYGAYYVEDTPSQPLSPPKSNYTRGLAPARPQRPDHSPLTDYIPSPQQRRQNMYQQFFESSPTHHGTGHWTEDGYASPNAARQSPTLEALIKQRAPLGPPPSARRGPSSYYSQGETPHVDPIVEETDSKRGSTQAGSHQSVSSNNNDLLGVHPYFRDDSSSIYSGVPSMPPSLQPATISPVDQSRPVSTVSDLNALVRNASLGLRTTPKQTTVQSADRAMQHEKTASTPKREFPVASPIKKADNSSPHLNAYPHSHGGSSDALGGASLDASASESEEPETLRPFAPVRTKSSSPLVPAELRKEVIEPPSSAFRSGKKRPPRLDMTAVTEAEQRGSLTSLPDLIKRATRLASNLDRGKTASRLGMGAWLNDSSTSKEKGKPDATTARRSANSLTDMLASFPPPAIGTPTGSSHSKDRKRALSTWSSNLKFSPQLPSEKDFTKVKVEPRSERPRDTRSRDKRRYCGLPLWLLILLIVIAVCLIAVAIILPVVLIVIPQQRNAQVTANTTTICEQKYTCQNGGASIVAADSSCQCVCINGYTGSSCTQQDRTGCYTVTIGSVSNVTLGGALPRIIDSAYSNFSIPLDSSILLGLFSSSGLSCTVENALVTFNGLAQRGVVERRQEAVTTDGIVYQNTNPTTSTTLATKTSATVAASTTAGVTTSSTVLDFARTVVLFVFEQTGSFNSSYAAQQNLQRFFSSSSSSGSLASANSLGLGSGYSADLSTFHVVLPNGTLVGGGSGHA